MVKIKGVGVRLDGRICNTMQAFALSERGIKPGLTVVLPETQKISEHSELDLECSSVFWPCTIEFCIPIAEFWALRAS